MKKLAMLLAVVMVICSFGAVTVFADMAGAGIEGDPYLISTADDLLAMSTNKNAHYKLAANIDLTGVTWTPFDFNGYLNGDNKEITNLTLDTTAGTVGMFTYLRGTVENLIIKSGSITTTNDNVGSIAGEAQNGAVIRNCVNYVNVTGDQNVGGFAGITNNALIENCKNYGVITTINTKDCRVGGIVGYAYNETQVTGCINEADLSGVNYIGGIVGADRDKGPLVVTNCTNNGNLNVTGSNNGGIVGVIQSASSEITNCTNAGKITGFRNLGGIVGTTKGVVKNCVNRGYVTAPKISSDPYVIGGIAGSFAAGTLDNCENYATVESGNDACGGIVGSAGNGLEITNCSNYGNGISGYRKIGGIVGEMHAGKISNCRNTGSVTANQMIGGIVGLSSAMTIEYCSNTGEIVCTGTANSIGGIVGQFSGESVIADCYNVSGGGKSAGLAGEIRDGVNVSIRNAYAYGDLKSAVFVSNKGTLNCQNLYYGGGISTANDATAKTAEEFADGTVVALLNGNRTGEYAVWEQGESYPVIRSSFSIKAVTSAEIAGSTATTVSYAVTLADEDATAKIIVALYNGDFLMAVKSVSADETSVAFETIVGATNAKIFVWENLTTIRPIVMDEYEF